MEGVRIYARASTGRFLARTICNPSRVGLAECGDPALYGKGSLTIGGPYCRGVVATEKLYVGPDGLRVDCKGAISMVGEGCLVAYFDGSRDRLGQVAGSWCGPRGTESFVLVGTVATVWDGEVAGMRLALEFLPVAPVLLLSDSQAAVSAVCNAAAGGWVRTADLKALVDAIGEWDTLGVPLRLAWVKVHVSVAGNGRADEMSKKGGWAIGDLQETEGGVKALWKWLRAGHQRVLCLGAGSVPRWDRRALSRYVQAYTGKGDLGVWRRRLDMGDGTCHLCRKGVVETGDHLAFECEGTRSLVGWEWNRSVDLDDRSKWDYEYEEGGRVMVGDRVEDFFAGLACEFSSVE